MPENLAVTPVMEQAVWSRHRAPRSCLSLDRGESLSRVGRPGHLLHRRGVAMTCLRQVDVPAAHAAERELQASGVAGRHGTPIVLRPHRDRLLAHGAHSELCWHRGPSLPTRGASRGSHSKVRAVDPGRREAGAELPECRFLDLRDALTRDDFEGLQGLAASTCQTMIERSVPGGALRISRRSARECQDALRIAAPGSPSAEIACGRTPICPGREPPLSGPDHMSAASGR